MKYLTHNDKKIETDGHLQGYIDADYNILVKLFGKPSDFYDDYKSDAEWQIQFKDGIKCDIYNYKDGKNYCGDDGLEVEEIREWHIGGNDKVVVERIQKLLNGEKMFQLMNKPSNGKLVKVKFQFDSDEIFDGFSDGSTWNGWDNIYVTDEAFQMVLDFWASEKQGDIYEIINDCFFECEADIPFDEKLNLFDFNGFVTTIYK